MNYAIISPDGHTIMQIGICPADMISLQGGDLLSVPLPEGVTDQSHWWNGEDFVAYPPRPSEFMTFDFATEEWVDQRTQEQVTSDFEIYRKSKLKQVNQTIGQIRSTFVTVLPAQDMVYLQKEAEAIAYLNDPASEPDLNNYPFIAAEVGITAPTASEVAQVYVNLAYQLRVVAAGLEQIRLGAVAAIESAADVPSIDAAVSYFETAIASLA